MKRTVALAWVIAGTAGWLQAQQPQQPIERTGSAFAITLQRGKLDEALAGRLADEALAVADGVFPAIERTLLIRRAAKPSRIHLHAVEATFRGVEKARTGFGALRQRVATLAQQEAHVLLWPQLLATDLAAVGLPGPTRTDIALVAAQLLAAQKSTAAVTDPWLAEVFAYAMLEGKQAQPPRFGIDPAFDSRRFLHRWRAKEANSLRYWVTELEPKPEANAVAYAEEGKCLAAQLLATGGGDWARRLLQEPARPGSTALVVRETAVERVLGGDWAKIDARWRKQIAGLEVPFYVLNPMVMPQGKRWVMVGTPDRAATLDCHEPLPEGPYCVRASFELRAPDDDGVRVQLDWNDASYIGLFFRAGDVRLMEWQPGKPWTEIRKVPVPIANGRPFDVAVEVGAVAGTLVVRVDGAECLRWPHGRTMRGSWSIAKNEIPVLVEGLCVEPATPK
jgi:hypothetical protein